MTSKKLMNSLVSKLLIANNLIVLAKFSENGKLSDEFNDKVVTYCLALVSSLYLSLHQACPTISIKLKLPYR